MVSIKIPENDIPNTHSDRGGLFIFRHEDFGLWFHRAECFRKRHRLRFLAVDDKDFLDIAGQRIDVAPQFMFVGVTGEGVERGDARADPMRLAEDVDRVLTGKNLRAQRVFGAVADEQNEIFHMADVVFQMVPDASGFTHA